MADEPEDAAEPTNEIAAEAQEVKQEDEAAKQLGSDELEERIANRVYDKIKGFVTELTTAAEDVQQMVSETVAAKAEEIGPSEDTAPEAPTEDVKPKRSHKLFSRPGKRE